MGKNLKLENIVKSYMEFHYPKLRVDEINILPTQTFSEKKKEWIPDSWAIFLVLHKNDHDLNTTSLNYILEGLTGCEVCLDFH